VPYSKSISGAREGYLLVSTALLSRVKSHRKGLAISEKTNQNPSKDIIHSWTGWQHILDALYL
jgi:hypothetical protein